MLDVAVAYNRYAFIGNEFLTWLWFLIENDPASLQKWVPSLSSLQVGNRMVLENKIHDKSERITIRGDDAGMEEGLLALRKGAVVIELNLAYTSEHLEWTFTLKGESLGFSALKVPQTAPMETKEDIEARVLEKSDFIEKTVQLVTILFDSFLRIRCSHQWNQTVVPHLKGWIQAGPATG